MEATWRILGDGLCIASLSIICSVSWQAWKRVPDDVRIPVQWRADQPAIRVSKRLGLLFTPILACVLLLTPTLLGVTYSPANASEAIVLFAVRALLASGLGFAHIVHIGVALETLRREGQLRS